MLESREDILTAFVAALIARSNGVLILNMDEIKESWNKPFKYEMVDNDLVFEFDK